jgi:hypothetical protein
VTRAQLGKMPSGGRWPEFRSSENRASADSDTTMATSVSVGNLKSAVTGPDSDSVDSDWNGVFRNF